MNPQEPVPHISTTKRWLGKRIRFDYETYSDLDITEVGTWRYAEDPSTKVLCATFRFDGKVLLWCPDTRLRKVPDGVDMVCRDRTFPKLIKALIDEGYRLIANNAEFEYAITRLVCGLDVRPDQFECMAAAQVYLHLPRGLDAAARHLGFAGKKDRGQELILKFSVPIPEAEKQKQAKLSALKLGKGVRRHQVPGQTTMFEEALPENKPVDELTFDDFVAYNVQDAEQTELIDKAIAEWWPEMEVKIWQMTLRMNERGVLIDEEYMRSMLRLQNEAPPHVVIEGSRYSYADLSNINFVKRELAVLGFHTPDGLTKHVIENALNNAKTLPKVRAILEVRRDASRVSLGKLEEIGKRMSYDGRLRGAYVYGGTDTLRWASWGAQLQNLPKPDKGVNSKECAKAIKERSLDKLLKAGGGFHNRALVAGLSGLLYAGPGRAFTKSDFAQIEARFVLWLADDERHLQWWREGRDMYCEMASKVFGREIKKGRDDKERDVGKRLVLACNFQLGGDKFEDVEAPKYGIDMAGLGITGHGCVQAFREEYYSLSDKRTGLWARLERAMRDVVMYGGAIREAHLIFRRVSQKHVWVQLPSGRQFVFRNCRIGEFRKKHVDKDTGLTYHEMIPDALIHDVETQHGTVVEDLYGGKLADLFTQASCRDLQAAKMLKLEAEAFVLELQTHDEVVTNGEEQKCDVDCSRQEQIMTTPEDWCVGFPIGVDSHSYERYLK